MYTKNILRITQTAPTVAALMDFPAPQGSDIPNEVVMDVAKKKLGGKTVEKALLYNPDAIALWLFQKYTPIFTPVFKNSDMSIPVYSVMPSVTPVCFASMYTGLMPEKHGIQAYVKPVLRVETLFDTAAAAGKKPIIISTEGDSISMIFLERNMDYIFCKTPDECNEKALEIIEKDEHDIIVVYNGNFDETMHTTGPEADAAINELKNNSTAYEKLVAAAERKWKGIPSMMAYLPDHGCHEIDGGMGSHGLDMDSDMNIVHFYKFFE